MGNIVGLCALVSVGCDLDSGMSKIFSNLQPDHINTLLDTVPHHNVDQGVLSHCSAALLCALRVAGIIVGHNRCTSVVKRVWGDRKCPMVSGTNCEVEYRVDEDWRLLDDSEGSLRLLLTG